MKSFGKAIVLLALVAAIISCNAFVAKPTTTPISTATNLPTLTFTSERTVTPTKKPTVTPLPPTETPSAPDFQMPTGKPATHWEGIPIMPKAIAGDGDNKGYSFTVKASPDEVQNFFEKEMKKLGWNKMAIGQGETKAMFLFFEKGSEMVTVGIIPEADGLILVLLVKT